MRQVHPDLWAILVKKNLAFMREISFVAQVPDYCAVLDLIWGLPMAGWARHCPSLLQRLSTAPDSIETALDDVHSHNEKVVASVRSSGDHDADTLAWEKCEKEFKTGGLLGPWSSMADIPFRIFRLLQRFVIHEQPQRCDASIMPYWAGRTVLLQPLPPTGLAI